MIDSSTSVGCTKLFRFATSEKQMSVSSFATTFANAIIEVTLLETDRQSAS